MATILHIETATSVCSTALSVNGKCIAKKADYEGQSHAVKLPGFIEDMLAFCRHQDLKLDAIAVSSGPGSYTGLRIGYSEAKGLCYGFSIPLIAVRSLKILASAAKNFVTESDAYLCPMIDARRMEVYTMMLDKNLNIFVQEEAKIVDENSFSEILNEHPVYFFGNGSDKCQTVISHPNAHFIPGIDPLAENMIELADSAFEAKQFADIAYSEPFYLKEFLATTPKKMF